MGFDRRFTLVLVAWVAALFAALVGLGETLRHGDLGAARVVAALFAAGALAGLVHHVQRTNVAVARFVETLSHRDLTARIDERGGAGFAELGQSLNRVLRDLSRERARDAEELRFWEALVDDLPAAVLLVDQGGGVRVLNKMGRRLFDRHDGTAIADFAVYGDALVQRLGAGAIAAEDLIDLDLTGGVQRFVVRTASVTRLGAAFRMITVASVQATLDRAEVGAQTDLIRVLTHEILNSLTPVTSLAGTAAVLLGEEEPDLGEARTAVLTLARRADGLRRFVESYRAIARLPDPRRRRFEAAPFAQELGRLFAAEWVDHRLEIEVEDGLTLDADPDLLAQASINLLRNAAQASEQASPAACVTMSIRTAPDGAKVLAVEDNGPGIAPDVRGDIFLPFFTTRPHGSGVGLNLVRQIAVAHGWRVDVGQAPAGGALLRLIMPPPIAA